MPFGILEAAGGLGVGLLVSTMTTVAKEYSTVPQDFEEGDQHLQVTFDCVEKYGKRFEPTVQEDIQKRYKDLLDRKEALQPIRSSVKRFLPSHKQSCSEFREKSKRLKEEIITRSQEARYRPTFLNSPIPEEEEDHADESRREAPIPEHGEGGEEVGEGDETHEVDCTSLMSSDILFGNQWRMEGRRWVSPAPLPLSPVSTT